MPVIANHERTTVTVPREIWEQMKRIKTVNWSGIATRAFAREIRKVLLQQRSINRNSNSDQSEESQRGRHRLD